MTELEPARLLDEQATPSALRDALQALRERAPSEASAARIGERLHDLPPPAHGSGAALATLAVLGLGALVAFLGWPERELRVPAATSSGTHALPPPAEPLAADSAPTPPARAAAPHEPVLQVAPVKPARSEPPLPAALPAPEPTRVPVAEKSVQPRPIAARAPAVVPEAAPAPATEPLPPEAKPAPVDDTERLFADPQDEAGLLYRAKRLSSSDPTAALRLLALHEASFPDGSFAEERDMLEIQIHERLGRAATAKRLAALFKQRYPGSVYRVSP